MTPQQWEQVAAAMDVKDKNILQLQDMFDPCTLEQLDFETLFTLMSQIQAALKKKTNVY